jgi:hypothetical protein
MEEPSFLTCKICGQKFKYVSNSHLKKHNMTCKEYKIKFGETSLVTPSLRKIRGDKSRGKSYEEIHGFEKSKQLKEVRSIDAKIQMIDQKQKTIREKCGVKKYNPIHAEWKKNISKAQTQEVQNKRRETFINNLKLDPNHYNDKGKHMTKTSKEATVFFINYCKLNNISFEEVIFSGNPYDKGSYEFGRLVWYPDCQKYIYTCYDFVRFKNSRSNILEIIEYQGCFHYSRWDVIKDPDSPYLPFKKEKENLTKKQSYLKDCTKLNFALTNLCKNVYEVWYYDKKLIKYLGDK